MISSSLLSLLLSSRSSSSWFLLLSCLLLVSVVVKGHNNDNDDTPHLLRGGGKQKQYDDNQHNIHYYYEEEEFQSHRKTPQEQEQQEPHTSPQQQLLYKKYKILSSQEIHDALIGLNTKYSSWAKLTTSQELYGLPKAGDSNDCPFDLDGNDGCNNYILTISSSSNSGNLLPEVLWSGALHGNERVGPTSVVEAASLLLEAVDCESHPNMNLKPAGVVEGEEISSSEKQEIWENELAIAQKCRDELKSKGIDNKHRKWLSRLASTRRIVVVPTANALGYYRNTRTEYSIDPNRDFPYDILPQDSSKCMQTVAGRTLNELFRTHLFQLSLTFHAGMEVIGYEWGAPSWLHHSSPDHNAQSLIANAYSQYANGWSTTHKYNTGTMNDLVYYVRGGMEDWAYAGSFTPSKVVQCTPATFGGNYPVEKTIYNNSTLRAFNMLVETSNSKTPSSGQLGTSQDVLISHNTASNGHVSRNIRLALLAVDLVEPYVSITSIGINDLILSDDIVPTTIIDDEVNSYRQCDDKKKTVMIPNNLNELVVNWTVGGVLEIDDTSLYYGKWDDLFEEISKSDSTIIMEDCLTLPKSMIIENNVDDDSVLTKGEPLTDTFGNGYFSHNGPQPKPSNNDEIIMGPIFSAKIDVSQYKPNDKIVVLAKARVDSSWIKDQPNDVAPNMPPQSHIVNARTNPNWYHTSEDGKKIIEGRIDWYTTIPLTIIIGEYSDDDNSNNGEEEQQVGFIELSNRFIGNNNNNGEDVDEGY